MSITYFLIGITVVVSLLAFQNHALLHRLLFYPYAMWRNNQWYRLITGGFVHLDFTHLFFNMFVLFSFGTYIEESFSYLFGPFGPALFMGMYLLAIILSDLINLFRKRHHEEYRSLGASGGVAAVVFAFILLNPFGLLYIFFIPIGIPAVIFGALYLAYSAYMARRQSDNIGHLAHFTGSVFGFLFPVMLKPFLLVRFFQLLLDQLR